MALKANALQRPLPDIVLPAAHFRAYALTRFRRRLFANPNPSLLSGWLISREEYILDNMFVT